VVQSEVGQANSSVNEFTLDDAHPAFAYLGPWNTDLSSFKNDSTGQNYVRLFNNQTEHSTSGLGAQASLAFRGSGVARLAVLPCFDIR